MVHANLVISADDLRAWAQHHLFLGISNLQAQLRSADSKNMRCAGILRAVQTQM
jgi:hypothetical protein